MTAPHSHPDDDALAEALADAWVERAMNDEKLRRLALRAAGLAKEPAEMTQEELAAEHGVSARQIRRVQEDALLKLRHHPLALDLLRTLIPNIP